MNEEHKNAKGSHQRLHSRVSLHIVGGSNLLAERSLYPLGKVGGCRYNRRSLRSLLEKTLQVFRARLDQVTQDGSFSFSVPAWQVFNSPACALKLMCGCVCVCMSVCLSVCGRRDTGL